MMNRYAYERGKCFLIITQAFLILFLTAQSPARAADPCDPCRVADPCAPLQTSAPAPPPSLPQDTRFAVIPIENMVDEGLYESIKRRTETALQNDITYIIYEVNTFGGRVDSAIAIWEYLIHDVAPRAHTVAYIPSKAISAGALISVACQDIIMKRGATVGDCAPISMGGSLEGVEREKMESPLRAYFENAANINNYPPALCKAMVTIGLEVTQLKNIETGRYEYFLANELPDQDNPAYDFDNKKIVVTSEQLATFTAENALEYRISRKTVTSPDAEHAEVIDFLTQRDNLTVIGKPMMLQTNWSEQLVRWLNSPAVAGILLMIGMIGIYTELNSPGLGLPGAVAVVALAVLFGSKFLIGMANWWEIALFMLGFMLLLLELFVIPGFGVAGISGILCMIVAFVAMMVNNGSDYMPIPQTDYDWSLLQRHILASLFGLLGFVIAAIVLSRYLTKAPFAQRFVLKAPTPHPSSTVVGAYTPQPIRQDTPAPTDTSPKTDPSSDEDYPVQLGDQGITITALRPAGKARFDKLRLDVVAQGAYIDAQCPVKVVDLEGNRIVVRALEKPN